MFRGTLIAGRSKRGEVEVEPFSVARIGGIENWVPLDRVPAKHRAQPIVIELHRLV